MPAFNHNQQWQYLNRIYVAQVMDVNTKEGVVDVAMLHGLGKKEDRLEIPCQISLKGFKSAWQRYMPSKGDLLMVGYGSQGQGMILGPASLPGVYNKIAELKNTNPTKFPHADFSELRSGEWDMRSSGGAYVNGNRDGALVLSAGPTTLMRMDKQEEEVRGDSGLWVLKSRGSNVRLGDIKRQLPSTYKEDTHSFSNVQGALKEFSVHLENPTLFPLPATLIADFELGGICDGDGIPRTGPIGPMRSRRKIYDAVATSALASEAYSEEIDVLGNVEISQGPLALSMDISGGGLSSLSTSFLNTSIDSDLTTTIGAGVSVITDTPLTLLGGAAAIANPIIRGTIYMGQFTGYLTALGVQLTALSVAMHGIALLESPTLTTPKAILFEAAATAMTTAVATTTTFAASVAPASLSTAVFTV